MALSLRERITNILISEKIERKEFAKRVGVTPQTASNFLNGRTVRLSPDMLVKIYGAFPNLSYEWLATGEGEMYEEDIFKLESEKPTPGKRRMKKKNKTTNERSLELQYFDDVDTPSTYSAAKVMQAILMNEGYTASEFARIISVSPQNIRDILNCNNKTDNT